MDFIVLPSKPLTNREVFLQDAMNHLAEMKAEKVALVAIVPGGGYVTAYFGMEMCDKITSAGYIQMDTVTDYIKANRDYLLEEEDDE